MFIGFAVEQKSAVHTFDFENSDRDRNIIVTRNIYI